IFDRSLIHVHDFENDPGIPTASREMARAVGHRSLVAVPMLRGEEPIGAISVGRRGPQGEVRPFSNGEITLLQTFADQAVIAIENVRLFTELQEKNRALTQAHGQVTEALEQQTSTSEILRVISQSPTDIQPVFDSIVQNGVRLCDGFFGTVTRYDGRTLNVVAQQNMSIEALEVVEKALAQPGSITSRALSSRAVVHIPDAVNAAEPVATVSKTTGYRTIISVPLLREGQPIGTINVSRRELQPFSDTEIALLKTFADQAVIAIENVRLFKELQDRNKDLTEALEQQTSTSEILRVISQSPTDVQPVFQTIVRNAVRLCDAIYCGVT